MIKTVSKEDLFGTYYVKIQGQEKLDSYYNTIKTLRPLLNSKESNETISGYYLNIYKPGDTVRISYFVDEENINKAESMFKDFFKKRNIIETQNSGKPRKLSIAKNYGGEHLEERYRAYLVLETLIGLDLIKENLLYSRRLFAIFRGQIRKAALPIREYFEPSFKQYSLVFNSLSKEDKDQFFTDLSEWPDPKQVDWVHMMVNMVLGGDFMNILCSPNYITPGEPLPIPIINSYLRQFGFGLEIPLNWKPLK